jgi:hypothetical protein
VQRMRDKLSVEIRLHYDLIRLSGAVDMLLTASQLQSHLSTGLGQAAAASVPLMLEPLKDDDQMMEDAKTHSHTQLQTTTDQVNKEGDKHDEHKPAEASTKKKKERWDKEKRAVEKRKHDELEQENAAKAKEHKKGGSKVNGSAANGKGKLEYKANAEANGAKVKSPPSTPIKAPTTPNNHANENGQAHHQLEAARSPKRLKQSNGVEIPEANGLISTPALKTRGHSKDSVADGNGDAAAIESSKKRVTRRGAKDVNGLI